MLKSLALKAEKDMNILMGVGVIKEHLKPKHDAKSKHKMAMIKSTGIKGLHLYKASPLCRFHYNKASFSEFSTE